jgi:hypothetical protein
MHPHLACQFFLAAAVFTSPVLAQPYELSFWPSPTASSDPRVVELLEHPCGQVAVARVSAIPPYKKDAVLVPERVFETNASGRVIRSWWLPTDSWIRGIKGSTLTIEHASKTYEVKPGGQITLAASSQQSTPLPRPTCKVAKELLPSDYAVCEVFKDKGSSIPRLLSYEAVCT